MTQIQKLELMNCTMLNYLKKINADTSKNEIISKILEDKACFFKIRQEDAYVILKDVGIKDSEINNVYNNLISSMEYYELKNKGIINEKDDEIRIKYDAYDINNLFKNEKSKKLDEVHLENNLQNYKENFLYKILNKIIKIFKK